MNFPADDFHNPSTGTYGHRMARTIQADHVYTVSPTTILDLRANLARYEEPNNDNGVNIDTSALGFPSSFTSQQAVRRLPAHRRPLRCHRRRPGGQHRKHFVLHLCRHAYQSHR